MFKGNSGELGIEAPYSITLSHVASGINFRECENQSRITSVVKKALRVWKICDEVYM